MAKLPMATRVNIFPKKMATGGYTGGINKPPPRPFVTGGEVNDAGRVMGSDGT